MLVIVLDNVSIADARLKAAVAVAAAHGAAYLLYLLFERHYRTVGKWLRPHFERIFAPRGARAHGLPGELPL
jgi:hypothetical protein